MAPDGCAPVVGKRRAARAEAPPERGADTARAAARQSRLTRDPSAAAGSPARRSTKPPELPHLAPSDVQPRSVSR